MRNRAKNFFLLLLSASFFACSSANNQIAPAQVEVNQPTVAIEKKVRKSAPLDVEIAQSFVDNYGKLNVRVIISPKTIIPTEQVAISLKGLKEGVVLSEQTKFLEHEISDKELYPEKTFALLFTLEEEELTEYQVACTWGEDTEKLRTHRESISSVAKFVSLKLEQLELDVKELPCPSAPCEQIYTISAKLLNTGTESIKQVELVSGIFWQNEGMELILPEDFEQKRANEEVIAIESLDLEPGAYKKLRISIDQALPQIPGGAFVPNLRILSSNPAN